MNTVSIFRGDTWQRTWVISDGQNPVDLTGASARLHVRDKNDALIMSASIANGRLIMQPIGGRIDLVMPKEITNVDSGKYKFDLEVTFANGTRKTYEQSNLVVMKDITHD